MDQKGLIKGKIDRKMNNLELYTHKSTCKYAKKSVSQRKEKERERERERERESDKNSERESDRERTVK